MSSLKWLGIWGMVNHSPPTPADINRWSRGMGHVLNDSNGRYHFKQYVDKKKITLPEDYPNTNPEDLRHLHDGFIDYVRELSRR
jgi:hypothetical protein